MVTYLSSQSQPGRERPGLSGQWETQGAGGGWAWVLSDLKSLLETGHSMFR